MSIDPALLPPAGPGVSIGLSELIAARIEVRRLGLALSGRILATRAGGHLSPFRGPGVEYDESRAYVPGDDPRSMDWRVTARAASPHVKVYREERERPVWLLVDQRASLRFATRVAFKSVRAAQVAALLGWAAVAHGDRVGGLVFDEQRRRMQRPAGRERGLLPLLRALAQGPFPARPASASDARLDLILAPLLTQIRPGSLIAVISDFLDLPGGQPITWLQRLADHSEVLLVMIYDPIESDPPPPGQWAVTDGHRRALLDMRSPGRRAQYAQRFVQRRGALIDQTRRVGAHLIQLATDQPPAATLARALGGLTDLRGTARAEHG